MMERDIESVMAYLGIDKRGLAAVLGVDLRSVNRWIDGSREVPEPTWRLMEALCLIQQLFSAILKTRKGWV